MEEGAHVVEAREVDVAVLLPLVPLPLDHVPLVLVAVVGLLPLHGDPRRRRRRRRRGAGGFWGWGFGAVFGLYSRRLPPAPRPNLAAAGGRALRGLVLELATATAAASLEVDGGEAPKR